MKVNPLEPNKNLGTIFVDLIILLDFERYPLRSRDVIGVGHIYCFEVHYCPTHEITLWFRD